MVISIDPSSPWLTQSTFVSFNPFQDRSRTASTSIGDRTNVLDLTMTELSKSNRYLFVSSLPQPHLEDASKKQSQPSKRVNSLLDGIFCFLSGVSQPAFSLTQYNFDRFCPILR